MGTWEGNLLIFKNLQNNLEKFGARSKKHVGVGPAVRGEREVGLLRGYSKKIVKPPFWPEGILAIMLILLDF